MSNLFIFIRKIVKFVYFVSNSPKNVTTATNILAWEKVTCNVVLFAWCRLTSPPSPWSPLLSDSWHKVYSRHWSPHQSQCHPQCSISPWPPASVAELVYMARYNPANSTEYHSCPGPRRSGTPGMAHRTYRSSRRYSLQNTRTVLA